MTTLIKYSGVVCCVLVNLRAGIVSLVSTVPLILAGAQYIYVERMRKKMTS